MAAYEDNYYYMMFATYEEEMTFASVLYSMNQTIMYNAMSNILNDPMPFTPADSLYVDEIAFMPCATVALMSCVNLNAKEWADGWRKEHMLWSRYLEWEEHVYWSPDGPGGRDVILMSSINAAWIHLSSSAVAAIDA
jgi:hypothetical protein